ncbi:hypothetical protein [Phenylobacterium koreense]|uniref:Lipoprotein n=2 Tax=Phenylobacterium TaxID=20 RepID=A0ABV2EG75_9CAUL
MKRTLRSPARAGAVIALALLGACSRGEQAAPPPKIAPPPAEKPAVLAPPPNLDRAGLLAAMADAASAYAAGAAVQSADPLVGRTFVARMPFGCLGPHAAKDAQPGLARWSSGANGRTIELGLAPADWTKTPLMAAAVGDKVWERVEGYWIDRPWLKGEACPSTPQAGASLVALPSPQTMGIAAVFAPDDSRLSQRKGRPYSFTIRGSEDVLPVPPPEGYRLVLEGRIVAFPDGRAVNCRSEGPDQRPICIVATQLDRVAFEDGGTGAQISEWR